MVAPDSEAQWLQQTRATLSDDIIREIVDIAIIENLASPSTLALVCKVTYRWTVPFIFRCIRLTWEDDTRDLLNLIVDETRDLASHVRSLHLIFPDLNDIDDTYAVTYAVNNLLLLALCRCTRLECLMFERWEPDEFIDQQVANFNTYPGPWDVRLPAENPSWILKPSNLPYLWNVTHFYCGICTHFVCGKGIEYFAMLPHVTHLAFAVEDIWGVSPGRNYHTAMTVQTLHTWLGRPSLKMVYVEHLGWNYRFKNGVLDHSRDWDRMIAIDDERLFVGRGLEFQFQYFMEDETAVWDCVKKRFGNWRTTVRDPSHIYSTGEFTTLNLDLEDRVL